MSDLVGNHIVVFLITRLIFVSLTAGSGTELRLYSQDPEKYVWIHICSEGNTQTYETCKWGFLDLFVNDLRPGATGDVDLTGLPWHLIDEDIRAITGMHLSDPAPMKFIFKGLGIFTISARADLFHSFLFRSFPPIFFYNHFLSFS